MSTPPKLAFIGFGEAGPAIAGGLKEAGVTDITAYDILQAASGGSGAIEARAKDADVCLASDHAGAIEGRDIIISTVTCTDAIAAAEAAAPHLTAGQFYLDVNSVSPETKAQVSALIAPSGASFVEASIMSPIYPKRHTAPMLLSGPDAPHIIERLAPFGMNLEDMGPEFGRAAATKMFRSIVFKGLEALLQECVVAADKYDVAEKVLDSVTESYPQFDWNKLASYFVGRSVMHGTRRAHEMEEVAETLRALKLDPFMAEGAARRIAWLADKDLKADFDGKDPEDYRDVLKALKNR